MDNDSIADSDNEVVIDDDDFEQPGVLRRGRSFRQYLDDPHEDIVLTQTETEDSDNDSSQVQTARYRKAQRDRADSLEEFENLERAVQRPESTSQLGRVGVAETPTSYLRTLRDAQQVNNVEPPAGVSMGQSQASNTNRPPSTALRKQELIDELQLESEIQQYTALQRPGANDRAATQSGATSKTPGAANRDTRTPFAHSASAIAAALRDSVHDELMMETATNGDPDQLDEPPLFVNADDGLAMPSEEQLEEFENGSDQQSNGAVPDADVNVPEEYQASDLQYDADGNVVQYDADGNLVQYTDAVEGTEEEAAGYINEDGYYVAPDGNVYEVQQGEDGQLYYGDLIGTIGVEANGDGEAMQDHVQSQEVVEGGNLEVLPEAADEDDLEGGENAPAEDGAQRVDPIELHDKLQHVIEQYYQAGRLERIGSEELVTRDTDDQTAYVNRHTPLAEERESRLPSRAAAAAPEEPTPKRSKPQNEVTAKPPEAPAPKDKRGDSAAKPKPASSSSKAQKTEEPEEKKLSKNNSKSKNELRSSETKRGRVKDDIDLGSSSEDDENAEARRKKEEEKALFRVLQNDYNKLLTKYALAEVTIDQMRLGAHVKVDYNITQRAPQPAQSQSQTQTQTQLLQRGGQMARGGLVDAATGGPLMAATSVGDIQRRAGAMSANAELMLASLSNNELDEYGMPYADELVQGSNSHRPLEEKRAFSALDPKLLSQYAELFGRQYLTQTSFDPQSEAAGPGRSAATGLGSAPALASASARPRALSGLSARTPTQLGSEFIEEEEMEGFEPVSDLEAVAMMSTVNNGLNRATNQQFAGMIQNAAANQYSNQRLPAEYESGASSLQQTGNYRAGSDLRNDSAMGLVQIGAGRPSSATALRVLPNYDQAGQAAAASLQQQRLQNSGVLPSASLSNLQGLGPIAGSVQTLQNEATRRSSVNSTAPPESVIAARGVDWKQRLIDQETSKLQLAQLAEKLQSDIDLLQNGLDSEQIDVDLQEELCASIKVQYDELQERYKQLRDADSEIRKQQILMGETLPDDQTLVTQTSFVNLATGKSTGAEDGRSASVNPEVKLEEALFNISLKLDDVNQRVDTNIVRANRRVPFQVAHNGNVLASGNAGARSGPGGTGLPSLFRKNSGRTQTGMMLDPTGMLLDEASQFDPETNQKLAQLEDEYVGLMSHYNVIKQMPRTAQRDGEIESLMQRLEAIANEAKATPMMGSANTLPQAALATSASGNTLARQRSQSNAGGSLISIPNVGASDYDLRGNEPPSRPLTTTALHERDGDILGEQPLFNSTMVGIGVSAPNLPHLSRGSHSLSSSKIPRVNSHGTPVQQLRNELNALADGRGTALDEPEQLVEEDTRHVSGHRLQAAHHRGSSSQIPKVAPPVGAGALAASAAADGDAGSDIFRAAQELLLDTDTMNTARSNAVDSNDANRGYEYNESMMSRYLDYTYDSGEYDYQNDNEAVALGDRYAPAVAVAAIRRPSREYTGRGQQQHSMVEYDTEIHVDLSAEDQEQLRMIEQEIMSARGHPTAPNRARSLLPNGAGSGGNGRDKRANMNYTDESGFVGSESVNSAMTASLLSAPGTVGAGARVAPGASPTVYNKSRQLDVQSSSGRRSSIASNSTVRPGSRAGQADAQQSRQYAPVANASDVHVRRGSETLRQTPMGSVSRFDSRASPGGNINPNMITNSAGAMVPQSQSQSQLQLQSQSQSHGIGRQQTAVPQRARQSPSLKVDHGVLDRMQTGTPSSRARQSPKVGGGQFDPMLGQKTAHGASSSAFEQAARKNGPSATNSATHSFKLEPQSQLQSQSQAQSQARRPANDEYSDSHSSTVTTSTSRSVSTDSLTASEPELAIHSRNQAASSKLPLSKTQAQARTQLQAETEAQRQAAVAQGSQKFQAAGAKNVEPNRRQISALTGGSSALPSRTDAAKLVSSDQHPNQNQNQNQSQSQNQRQQRRLDTQTSKRGVDGNLTQVGDNGPPPIPPRTNRRDVPLPIDAEKSKRPIAAGSPLKGTLPLASAVSDQNAAAMWSARGGEESLLQPRSGSRSYATTASPCPTCGSLRHSRIGHRDSRTPRDVDDGASSSEFDDFSVADSELVSDRERDELSYRRRSDSRLRRDASPQQRGSSARRDPKRDRDDVHVRSTPQARASSVARSSARTPNATDRSEFLPDSARRLDSANSRDSPYSSTWRSREHSLEDTGMSGAQSPRRRPKNGADLDPTAAGYHRSQRRQDDGDLQLRSLSRNSEASRARAREYMPTGDNQHYLVREYEFAENAADSSRRLLNSGYSSRSPDRNHSRNHSRNRERGNGSGRDGSRSRDHSRHRSKSRQRDSPEHAQKRGSGGKRSTGAAGAANSHGHGRSRSRSRGKRGNHLDRLLAALDEAYTNMSSMQLLTVKMKENLQLDVDRVSTSVASTPVPHHFKSTRFV